MEGLLLEPLKFFEKEGKSKHESLANERFDGLVAQSKLNVEENRKTAAEYRKQDAVAQNTLKRLNGLKVLRMCLVVAIIVAYFIALVGFLCVTGIAQTLCVIIGAAVGTVCLFYVLLSLNKKIKNSASIFKKQKAVADKTLKLAYSQMECLNKLFNEKDTFDLIEKTVSGIKFEDNFTVELLNDFAQNYDYVDEINGNRSVTNTLSGRFNGNPFLFYRYVNHYMGSKTYHGSKFISWTERRRGSDGKYYTVTRTQTLYASVTKPCPYYSYGTALVYGNQTAPDLSFKREATDVEELSERQVEKRVKKGQKKIRKMTEQALANGGGFTEMTNAEFDVLFGALDRNHEVQFRVMFSPVAQLNMVKLLKGDDVGFGDDFSFEKRGRFNKIVSEHAQGWNMDTSPSNYFSYDVDIARSNYLNYNAKYFKSVFFDFAPLLSVPNYQEKPNTVFKPLEKYNANYTPYDYEVLANTIGATNFAHPRSITDVILKTSHEFSKNTTDCVNVKASSYAGEDNVDFIPVYGGDGRMHSVPVPWVKYIPVEKISTIAVKRLGVDRNEFNARTLDGQVSSALFGAPSAYTHGLFAKIAQRNDVDAIDGVLDKIRKI